MRKLIRSVAAAGFSSDETKRLVHCLRTKPQLTAARRGYWDQTSNGSCCPPPPPPPASFLAVVISESEKPSCLPPIKPSPGLQSQALSREWPWVSRASLILPEFALVCRNVLTPDPNPQMQQTIRSRERSSAFKQPIKLPLGLVIACLIASASASSSSQTL